MDGHGLGCSGAARPHMVDFKAGKHREGTRRRTPPCLCARPLLFALHDGFGRKTSLKARGVHSSSRVKVPKLPFSASYSSKRAAQRVSAHTNEALRQVSSDPAGADRQEAEVSEGCRKRRGRVVQAGRFRAAAARSASVSPVALTSQPRTVAAPYNHILARRAHHPASSGLIQQQNTSKSVLHLADGKL